LKVTLGSLTSEEPCYGISATAVTRTDENQPKYIRITDFNDFGIEENHEYVTTDNYAEKHILKPGDILFARTGATVGKTYYYDGSIGKAVFAGYCIRFRFDEKKVFPKYAYWYTKTSAFINWVKGIQRPSGQPNINKEEYKSFEIILPDHETQKRVSGELDVALEKRKDRLTKANELLMSIKSVMTEKLSISLNTFNNNISFAIKLSKVLNNKTHRLDPKCYSDRFLKIIDCLNKSCYKTHKLKDLITNYISGDWGKSSEDISDSYVKCLVIRATEFDNSQNIRINENKVQYRAISIKSLEKQNKEIGDILVEKSGGSKDQPVGRVVFVDRLDYNNTPISYSNFLTKLKIDQNKIDPYYLFEYLRFVYNIGLTEVMQNQTNGIRNLIMDEYLDIPVIIPPNDYEIGQSIKDIRNRALELQIEAENKWQEAKKQFEKELLGE